jgi:hypothetical protein
MVTTRELKELEKLEREIEELERLGEKAVIEELRALSKGKQGKSVVVIPKVTTFIREDENGKPMKVLTLKNPLIKMKRE